MCDWNRTSSDHSHGIAITAACANTPILCKKDNYLPLDSNQVFLLVSRYYERRVVLNWYGASDLNRDRKHYEYSVITIIRTPQNLIRRQRLGFLPLLSHVPHCRKYLKELCNLLCSDQLHQYLVVLTVGIEPTTFTNKILPTELC